MLIRGLLEEDGSWLSRELNYDWPPGNRKGLKIETEKAMAPHSSTLAWKIPWTEEPGRLQSIGSLTVGDD